jgi:formamidopyrimidine-DNA glycosylase
VPELPDVEGFRREFERHAAGKTVRAVHGVDSLMLHGSSPQALGRSLKNRRFARPRRHGKLLICETGGPTLLLHFGMTGCLVWDGETHPHDRLVLELGDGALRYRDMRRLGGIWLARDDREVERIVGRLGPDWLGVTRERFDELLDHRRGGIKAALMDQRFAAGLGNLTTDEALWRARIHPRRPVGALRPHDRDRLYRAIRRVLRDSLPHGRVPVKRTWLTGARDRRDATCPRCGARLERITVAGRTSVVCRREQREGGATRSTRSRSR